MGWTCTRCYLPEPKDVDEPTADECNCDRCIWCSAPPDGCDCEADGDTRTQQADWAFEDAL